MVYTSSSLALSAIELFVHLDPSEAPADLVSISAELPKGEPGINLDVGRLPPEWWAEEAAVRDLGNEWIRAQTSLAMRIPSVPIRSEWNVLINPTHPRMTEVKIEPAEPFVFDARMFQR